MNLQEQKVLITKKRDMVAMKTKCQLKVIKKILILTLT